MMSADYWRRLWNGLVYGSPQGPAIEIDWENRTVTYHRMGNRLSRRLARMTHYIGS